MAKTRTQLQKAEYDRVFHEQYEKLRQVIREEFRPGTKVTWEFGIHVQTGTVVEVHEFGTEVRVKNDKTGKIVDKEAHHLGFVAPPPPRTPILDKATYEALGLGK